METYLMSAAAAVAVFLVFLLLLPKSTASNQDLRKRNFLDRVKQENESAGKTNEPFVQTRDVFEQVTSPLGRLALALPFNTGKRAYELLLKAGWGEKIPKFLIICLIIFIVIFSLLSRTQFSPVVGFMVACFFTFTLTRKYLRRTIEKRNEKFVNQFPDAIDMIVRSVRSGHPLNTAFRMISENMDTPLGPEFRQVVDEIAYGRTLVESLVRLSHRIDEPDLNFFVVVLSVQQETGGNLAEVLSNLSNVIRKRRQLRLKIKAMTSEGRATGYILGGLPVTVFCALYFLSPGYLDPLLHTMAGNILMCIAAFMIWLATFIVKKMVQIDI
jgi:tight adherence protein B